MMLDATQKYALPLKEERLFGWHAALFPTVRSGMRNVKTGTWRTGGMEVVSGPEGKEKIHFEGPGPEAVEPEMRAFLAWYEDNATSTEPLIKAGLAHLYFATIHPFEDGNGRIARAITEMSLARLENSAQRFYSMSSASLSGKTFMATMKSWNPHKRVEWTSGSGSCGFSIISGAPLEGRMN